MKDSMAGAGAPAGDEPDGPSDAIVLKSFSSGYFGTATDKPGLELDTDWYKLSIGSATTYIDVLVRWVTVIYPGLPPTPNDVPIQGTSILSAVVYEKAIGRSGEVYYVEKFNGDYRQDYLGPQYGPMTGFLGSQTVVVRPLGPRDGLYQGNQVQFTGEYYLKVTPVGTLDLRHLLTAPAPTPADGPFLPGDYFIGLRTETSLPVDVHEKIWGAYVTVLQGDPIPGAGGGGPPETTLPIAAGLTPTPEPTPDPVRETFESPAFHIDETTKMVSGTGPFGLFSFPDTEASLLKKLANEVPDLVVKAATAAGQVGGLLASKLSGVVLRTTTVGISVINYTDDQTRTGFKLLDLSLKPDAQPGEADALFQELETRHKVFLGTTVSQLGADLGNFFVKALRFDFSHSDLVWRVDIDFGDIKRGITFAAGHRDLFIGGSDADVVNGGDLEDVLYGGDGGDQLFGGTGNDLIHGGDGVNYLRGDEGDDRLFGGADFDDINGNMGNDTVSTGAGEDYCVGGKDNDNLDGGAAYDLVYGNLGNDTCAGGDGNDIVRGGQDNDLVLGGAGDDFVSGDKGADTMTGGSGADIFHTFGDAGLDRVTDFSRAQGDRVQLDPGTVFTVSQVGADTVIDMVGGGKMILAGVAMSSLTGAWIFGA